MKSRTRGRVVTGGLAIAFAAVVVFATLFTYGWLALGSPGAIAIAAAIAIGFGFAISLVARRSRRDELD